MNEKNIFNMKTAEKIRYPVLFCACIFICIYLTVFAREGKDSIVNGINLCFGTLIPSMFPFLFLSAFMAESGILNIKSEKINSLSVRLFGIPCCGISAFFLSIIGGYPVGAKTVKALYENNNLTQNQAKRLMLFSVNPGPAFAVTALGLSMLSNKKAGVIIYSSVVLSNILIGILTMFLFDREYKVSYYSENAKLSQAFLDSGEKASVSMIDICSFVLIFSFLCEIIETFVQNDSIRYTLTAFLEVTNACQILCELKNIPLLAGVIAFGGVCVHLQIFDCITAVELDKRLFLTSRTVSSALSVIICDLLLKIFPIEEDVFVSSSGITVVPDQVSFPASIAMLMTCLLFLLGDYTLKKHKNVETNRKI